MLSTPRPLPPQRELPFALPAGGRIFLWAPSSPAATIYHRRFTRGIHHLTQLGYEVHAGHSCHALEGLGALPPAVLAEELHQALRSQKYDAVVCTAGGWTVLPVLEHLDWDLIRRARLPIVGYSDITLLLHAVTWRAGLVSFHGPMLLPEWATWQGSDPYTHRSFTTVLQGGTQPIPVEPSLSWSDELLWWDKDDDRQPRPRHPTQDTWRTIRPGRAEGRLWGGSLTALGLLPGTPYWHIEPDAVVFLETEEMAPDEFWARLHQLTLSGLFDQASGLIIGRHSRPRVPLGERSEFDTVLVDATPAHLPILAGADLGHTQPMCTLPIGGTATLDCTAPTPKLLIDSAVSAATDERRGSRRGGRSPRG